MKEPFSTREWAGMLAASGWGAVLPLVPFDKFGAFAIGEHNERERKATAAQA